MRHLVAVIPHRDPEMFQNFFALNEEEFDLGLKFNIKTRPGISGPRRNSDQTNFENLEPIWTDRSPYLDQVSLGRTKCKLSSYPIHSLAEK